MVHQIPVDDPPPVRLVQRIRDLDGNRECLIEWQRTLLQPLGHDLPVEILHDQEVDAVPVADVVEMADVRVVQRGDRAGLELKSLLQVRIGGDMLGQHLDSDSAVQASVGGFVDLAHAACAEGSLDQIFGAKRGRASMRRESPSTTFRSYWATRI